MAEKAPYGQSSEHVFGGSGENDQWEAIRPNQALIISLMHFLHWSSLESVV